ncbi:MAG: hypothetical protein EDR02_02005 [Actinobacteria bacterium]|nr:MAG: hypothetical protein EDR02_02005 [Actinomycetota bacterium]
MVVVVVGSVVVVDEVVGGRSVSLEDVGVAESSFEHDMATRARVMLSSATGWRQRRAAAT